MRLIERFIQHRVAATLLMLLMAAGGLWALTQLPIQIMPDFNIQSVRVSVAWPGAMAEDVETSILIPLEENLRHVPELKTMQGQATAGACSITLEFASSTDLNEALTNVRDHISQAKLPNTAEPAQVSRILPQDTIARILISGDISRERLRDIVHDMENDLRQRGIPSIRIPRLARTRHYHRCTESHTDECRRIATTIG